MSSPSPAPSSPGPASSSPTSSPARPQFLAATNMRRTILLILALTHSASAAARAGGIMKQLKGDPAEVGKQRAQLQREVDAVAR